MAKVKVDTSKGPDPKSIRSKKRANRGFKSVASSTRMGRRAAERSAIARTIGRDTHAAGEKVRTTGSGEKRWLHTAGGADHHH
jgi:hypothetical protein